MSWNTKEIKKIPSSYKNAKLRMKTIFELQDTSTINVEIGKEISDDKLQI